ncbi:MAG: peptide deformylase [Candidatus Omnitrophica bacterium]|nr:peptide deformylase [Candidatus Omnitrophota bacterium]
MAILNIIKYPDPCLRKKCRKVEVVNTEIRKLLDDMAMTMYAANGVGLAASQVGMDIRVIVIDTGQELLKLVNPEIIKAEGTSLMEEGCLSLPNTYVKVSRKKKLVVSALDDKGKRCALNVNGGLLAHAFGQEIDHLNGKLIIDYLPFYKKIFSK